MLYNAVTARGDAVERDGMLFDYDNDNDYGDDAGNKDDDDDIDDDTDGDHYDAGDAVKRLAYPGLHGVFLGCSQTKTNRHLGLKC
jgi:hypothetical protein